MARIYGLRRRRAAARISANTDVYKLGALLRQRAGTLSGGQKQRLALAAVTLHEPRLLLLDEPTSAVDPQSRREFWDSLFELTEHGTTILVSTHFMDEAERCHRLAILDRGRLVAEGEPRVLADSIDAIVLEVRTEEPRRSRLLLGRCDFVLSVTQLGSRLRVTVPTHLDDAPARIDRALVGAGIAAEVLPANANLEDVFVSATVLRDKAA
jgi:ABC-2 type transport system ATP-binding protein